MPCSDITDRLTLILSADDRLLDYRLEKKTCGAPVGVYDALIQSLGNRTADQLLDLTFAQFAADLSFADNTSEFLAYKHFQALLAGVSAYLGQPAEDATVSAVSVRDGISEVTIDITHALPATEVRPCVTACSSCTGACR